MVLSRIRDDEGFLQPIIDSIGEGIIVSDLTGRPLIWNAAAERILGVASFLKSSNPWTARPGVYRPDGVTELPVAERPLPRAIRGEAVDDQELLIRAEGKADVLVSETARALRDGTNAVIGGVSIFREITARREIENKLKESERLYRTIVQQLPSTVVLMYDRSLRVMLAGGGALAGQGLSVDEIEGQPLQQVSTPEGFPHYVAALEGTSAEIDILRGGRSFRVKALPVRDENGAVFAGLMLAEDVTETKRARAAQLRMEVLLGELTEKTHDAVITADAEGNVTGWNAAAVRTFGYQAEEVVGESLTTLMPERFRSAHLHGLARFRATEVATVIGNTVEVVGLRKDGTEFPCELSLSTWKNEEAPFFTGIVRDISERKRAEEAMRASEARFRALSTQAPVGIFETDPDGNCTFVNERWSRQTGLSFELAAGQGWVSAVHPDDGPAVFAEWTASVREEREFHLEYRFQRGPEVVWVTGGSVALRDMAGRVTGYLGTTVDITEPRRAREATRRSLEEKEVLLKEIHHRVKNNLQIISSLLRLQAARITDVQARDIFADSEARVRSIAMLHEKLYGSHDLASIDMEVYVNGLMAELRRTYGGAAGKVDFVVDGGGVDLTIGSAVPCALIVNELLTNSLKHGFRGGRVGLVSVRFRQLEAEIELTVSDDGEGFPPELDLAKARSMGITLVRTLTGQLDGTLAFSSSGGASCTIRFPVPDDDEGLVS
jgi:PAS domain S-box-containing protein